MKYCSLYTSLFIMACIFSFKTVQGQNFFQAGAGAGATGTDLIGVGANNQTAGTSGNQNISLGSGSLMRLTSGYSNVGLGCESLGQNSTGAENVGIGFVALQSVTSNYNTGAGAWCMNQASTGSPNTGLGYAALYMVVSGQNNVAVGAQSMYSTPGQTGFTALGAFSLNTTSGSTTSLVNCTAAGAYSLQIDGASDNTACGFKALYSNTTGTPNDAFGENALYSNLTGSKNVAIGYKSLYTNTAGNYNTAAGYQTLFKNTGSTNSALGYEALYNNSVNGPNDAFGAYALVDNTSGYYNSAIGYEALATNSTAIGNVAAGYRALYTSTGADNTAIGMSALSYNSTGAYNTALGEAALYSNGVGNDNTGVGAYALYDQSGSGNTAGGAYAGEAYTSYTNCTFLGEQADASGNGYSNATAIGYYTLVTGSNYIQLGNTGVSGVYTNSGCSYTSDGRFKKEIKAEVPGISFIKKLRPITYQWDMAKLDEHIYGKKTEEYEKALGAAIQKKGKTIYTGFIAQEVDKAAKDVGYDFTAVTTPQNETDLYRLDYKMLVPSLVSSVQEQDSVGNTQLTRLQKDQYLVEEVTKSLDAETMHLQMLSSQLQDLTECCEMKELTMSNKSIADDINAPQLLMAVPNPTSEFSTIYYFAPQTAKTAIIKLLDANGNILIDQLTGGLGYASVKVETTRLASGTYFYSLVVDGKIIGSKKLVVLSR